MPSRVDVEGLLRLLAELEGQSLPFVVRPARGVAATEILAAVRDAVAAADASALTRNAGDPTGATEPDATVRGVVAELAEGSMDDGEVRLWFADLARALDERGVSARVVARPPDRRIPDLYPWLSLPPAVTAFLHFTSDHLQDGVRSVADDVLRRVVPPLASWVHVPAGTTIVETGLTDTVSTPGRAASEILSVLPIDPQQLGFSCVALEPRRQRYARIGLGATGKLQVLDDTQSLVDHLAAVCEALTIVGHYLDYAAVRRAKPTLGSYGDPIFCLGREPTPGEEIAHTGRAEGLLDRYVVDAWVAQVLTERHLDATGPLAGFDLTELGHRRFLAVAHDPAPWLADRNPDPAVWDAARTAFHPCCSPQNG